ncbi:betaC1 [Pea leaf distortion betasatellite]|uniref:BetaC1 n=1 Tax=Pea leaf distortion betasatellite TaxID=1931113 RepID=A0A1P8JPQ3_9VIRU|nr:betaC1 [Pea leaf distortion betasatellite]APW35717.1 betaC1 [Pea leaf distortion betasatellite]APW35718.1 betaC1 [Pea leaf distortion betasatellite]APW35719.1 betaC1 [Pea leaf distortion betasatellite]APW35720.1 betaC1 [Pea leaf distortion betasatellite]APW35721.1 betaC1 [Pea leaf distortion betasatellite]
MTIEYRNNKGLGFIIDVRRQGAKFVMVKIRFSSTRSPALIKRRINIPYGHDGIIIPFDFNGLETGIRDMIETLFKDTAMEEFRVEEMIEMIDLLMMQDANVENINLDVEYDVTNNTSA